MRRFILLALVAIACSSCGTFRKVFKAKESHSVKVEQSSVSSASGTSVDKSITTITERIDTTITTPGREVIGQVPFNMDSLVNGMTAIKNELIDVRLHLNPITGILSAVANIKPVATHVHLDKTTVKQNDIVEQSNNQTTTDLKAEVKDSASTTNKEPAKMGIWLISFLIVVAVGGFLFWRKR